MATILLADGAEIDGEELYRFLVAQPGFSPK
jgi:hypothetical protein